MTTEQPTGKNGSKLLSELSCRCIYACKALLRHRKPLHFCTNYTTFQIDVTSFRLPSIPSKLQLVSSASFYTSPTIQSISYFFALLELSTASCFVRFYRQTSLRSYSVTEFSVSQTAKAATQNTDGPSKPSKIANNYIAQTGNTNIMFPVAFITRGSQYSFLIILVPN